MLVLLITTAVCAVLAVIGVITLAAMINTYTKEIKDDLTTMLSVLDVQLSEIADIKEDLTIAVSKLPKSRSKKVIEENTASCDSQETLSNEQ